MEQTIGVGMSRKQVQQRDKGDILKALAEFEQSAMSIREFVAKYQVSKATFYNWRKKYQSKNTRKVKNNPPGFIPVSMAGGPMAEQNEPAFAEYHGIIFYQRVEPAYLKALLK